MKVLYNKFVKSHDGMFIDRSQLIEAESVTMQYNAVEKGYELEVISISGKTYRGFLDFDRHGFLNDSDVAWTVKIDNHYKIIATDNFGSEIVCLELNEDNDNKTTYPLGELHES